MDKDRIYNTDELYIGSIVEITGRNFSRVDLNNNQPWREIKYIEGFKDNLFIKKEGQTYIHLRSGQEAVAFGDIWGEGKVGLDLVKPLKERLKLAFDSKNIQSLDLDYNQVMQLEQCLANNHIESLPNMFNAFKEFLESYERENEEG